MTEDWPARPAAHLFYAQEKAQIERLLSEEAAGHPGLGLYLVRPAIVLGPDAVGAKSFVPAPLAPLVRRIVSLASRLPLPVITLPVPIQFIHEEDVGRAFLLCIVGVGAPGVLNITGDGVLSGAQVLRELGLTPIPAPGAGQFRPRRGSYARPRAALPPGLSPGRSPVGRSRCRTQQSWTRAKPSGSSAGARGTAASWRCATR
jgi:nucleoside-diphosphate-sugar epimerase